MIAAARPVPGTPADAHASRMSGLCWRCQGVTVLGNGANLNCGMAVPHRKRPGLGSASRITEDDSVPESGQPENLAMSRHGRLPQRSSVRQCTPYVSARPPTTTARSATRPPRPRRARRGTVGCASSKCGRLRPGHRSCAESCLPTHGRHLCGARQCPTLPIASGTAYNFQSASSATKPTALTPRSAANPCGSLVYVDGQDRTALANSQTPVRSRH